MVNRLVTKSADNSGIADAQDYDFDEDYSDKTVIEFNLFNLNTKISLSC